MLNTAGTTTVMGAAVGGGGGGGGAAASVTNAATVASSATSSLVMPTTASAAVAASMQQAMAITPSSSGGGFIIHHPSGAIITPQQITQSAPQQQQSAGIDIEDKSGIIVNIDHNQQQHHQHHQPHPHSQQIVMGDIMDYKDASLIGTASGGGVPTGDNHHNYASANTIVVSESGDYQHIYQQQQRMVESTSVGSGGSIEYQPGRHPDISTMIKHEVL